MADHWALTAEETSSNFEYIMKVAYWGLCVKSLDFPHLNGASYHLHTRRH